MRVLIFDMDGVLVDPTDSYRRALVETVEHFTGKPISQERIVELKNHGGFNDDYILAHSIIGDHGVPMPFEEVVAHYRSLFWGTNGDGLILKERWLAGNGLLARLACNFRLAIFTGRSRRAAQFTLNRFARDVPFDPVVTSDQLENPKPAPDGLLAVLDVVGEGAAMYVGDNVDDARAARAAGVPFVGVAASDALRRPEIEALFQAESAVAVIPSVNEVESIL